MLPATRYAAFQINQCHWINFIGLTMVISHTICGPQPPSFRPAPPPETLRFSPFRRLRHFPFRLPPFAIEPLSPLLLPFSLARFLFVSSLLSFPQVRPQGVRLRPLLQAGQGQPRERVQGPRPGLRLCAPGGREGDAARAAPEGPRDPRQGQRHGGRMQMGGRSRGTWGFEGTFGLFLPQNVIKTPVFALETRVFLHL